MLNYIHLSKNLLINRNKSFSHDSYNILFLYSILSAYESYLTPSYDHDTSPKPFRTNWALSLHFKKDGLNLSKLLKQIYNKIFDFNHFIP